MVLVRANTLYQSVTPPEVLVPKRGKRDTRQIMNEK